MNFKDILLIVSIIGVIGLFIFIIWDKFSSKKNVLIKTETLNSNMKNARNTNNNQNNTKISNIDLQELDIINKGKNQKIGSNNTERILQELKDKFQNIDNNNYDNRYQVLIVDDSNLSLIAAISALNEESELFNIQTAYDGLDAWLKLSNNKPDIIITDIDMPRWNGEKLIDRIKSSLPLSSIPIIVMTSNMKHQYKMFSNKKISGFFPKPLDDTTTFRVFIKRILSQ